MDKTNKVFTYDLVKNNGVINGVKNGEVGRVDSMFLTVLNRLLSNFEITTSEDEVKRIKETLEVKSNNKNNNTYDNYYLDGKQVMCIKNNRNLIGELYLTDNMIPTVLEIIRDILDKTMPKDERKPQQRKAVANNDSQKVSPKKENKERPIRKQRRTSRLSPDYVSPLSEKPEDKKAVLDTLTPELMQEKGFSFMSEDEYNKRPKY